MSAKPAASPGLEETIAAIKAGDRVALGRAITLAESARPEDQASAQELLDRLSPLTGTSVRVGISGVPGAGKSTLIDQLGLNLVAQGHKVAVLAVDPTSTRSGGSILGDKTRMGRLASEAAAFIRPSPAGESLGGVTKTTRETIALVEAAGYDVVLVETVGVGQSETAVSNMVDVFVVVGIPGAGDELQGIKRGLLELADIIAVNKADSDQIERANRAAMEYRTGLHILAAGNQNWSPVVLTVSARDNRGLDELWAKIKGRHAALAASGALAARRADQAVAWMREIFEQRLLAAFKGSKQVSRCWKEMEETVRSGRLTPAAAAAELGRVAGIAEPESNES
jgi:LAO/AO transport system kinase